jgi:hypothetical protein
VDWQSSYEKRDTLVRRLFDFCPVRMRTVNSGF